MAKQVDKTILSELIVRLDAEKKYSNRTALYTAVSNEYHSAHQIRFSPTYVGLRVKEWNIELVTPLGVKGRAKGSKILSKEIKLKGNKSLAALRGEMEKDIDAKSFLGLLAKVERGSLKSALKLNCLYCANWQKQEVKFCQCNTCPLHSIRPCQ